MLDNAQPREKQDVTDGNVLDVYAIWPTIQGEGPYTGRPATFIRLAGCNFQCTKCDTDYTSKRYQTTVAEIVEAVKCFGYELVVITGGEPFRQNIGPLCRQLVAGGFLVQIETNGSLSLPNFCWSDVMVIVSPKSGHVHDDIRQHAFAWKYVVEAGHVDELGFPTRVLGIPMNVAKPPARDVLVYVQPLDVDDEVANTNHMLQAVTICLKHPGRLLCLQVHKIAGLK